MRKIAIAVLLLLWTGERPAAQEYVSPNDTLHVPRIAVAAHRNAQPPPAPPDGLELAQNFPNPFNPATTIRYNLPERGEVTLRVFDEGGREVRTLVRGVQSAGRHNVRFDASDVPSGTYHYRLEFGGYMLSRSMLFLK